MINNNQYNKYRNQLFFNKNMNISCFFFLCFRNIKTLNVLGLAPKIYAIFENGLAYQYYPGQTLDVETVTNDNIWPLVATQMAKMHKVQLGRDVCIFYNCQLAILTILINSYLYYLHFIQQGLKV